PVPGLRGLRGVLLRLIRLPAWPLPRARIDLDAQHRVAVDAAVAKAACLARTVDHAEDGFDIDVQYPLPALRTLPLHRHAAPPLRDNVGPTLAQARSTRMPPSDPTRTESARPCARILDGRSIAEDLLDSLRAQ